jgi:enamine deaminase RidA (YjgF/YER057c/UK114 family)
MTRAYVTGTAATTKEAGLMKRGINPSPALTFPAMSQAVRAGELLVLAGQVALDEDGNLVGPGDPVAQAEQCFRNIEQLLELGGASLRDVVKLTCFLSDKSVYPAYAAAKQTRFSSDAPAGTAVVVSALLDERFLLEVEAIAVIGSG